VEYFGIPNSYQGVSYKNVKKLDVIINTKSKSNNKQVLLHNDTPELEQSYAS
jgi:hypothetical protein